MNNTTIALLMRKVMGRVPDGKLVKNKFHPAGGPVWAV